MNIKHLIILFLVNCSHDAATAECNTVVLDTLTSTADSKDFTGVHIQTSTVLTQLHNHSFYNNTNAYKREMTISCNQIAFVVKKLLVGEYKRTVLSDSDFFRTDDNQYTLSIEPKT